MDKSDQAIVEKCLDNMRSGKDFREDYSVLVRRYSRLVFAVVLSRVKDYHRAEELVQDVFIKAYRKLNGFSGRGSFVSWLYAIAANCCKDYSRRKNPPLLSIDEVIINNRDIPVNLYHHSPETEINENRREINQAILSLPQLLREPAIMRFLNDLSYRQIARKLGVSESAIKTRLFRARKMLHESLQPLMARLKGGS